MDEVLSKSSSRILIELEYKYKAEYYNRLYPTPIYPYSKPKSYTGSLAQSIFFYGDPIKRTNLKLDLDLDLDQLLNWEKHIVSLIKNRESARSPRKFYVGTKKRLERIEFDLTMLPEIIEACEEIVFFNKSGLFKAEIDRRQPSKNSITYLGFNNELLT